MKTQKYTYLKVIQQNYGHGWEDNSEYEVNSQGVSTELSGMFRTSTKTGLQIPIPLITYDLQEYRLTGYPTRLIFRKVCND